MGERSKARRNGEEVEARGGLSVGVLERRNKEATRQSVGVLPRCLTRKKRSKNRDLATKKKRIRGANH